MYTCGGEFGRIAGLLKEMGYPRNLNLERMSAYLFAECHDPDSVKVMDIIRHASEIGIKKKLTSDQDPLQLLHQFGSNHFPSREEARKYLGENKLTAAEEAALKRLLGDMELPYAALEKVMNIMKKGAKPPSENDFVREDVE